MYNQLQHNDLIKRGPARLDTFIDMIKEGKMFLTIFGLVKLDPIADLKPLRETMLKSGYSSKFSGKKESGQKIELQYPKDFLKSPEFGGKGAGSGTAAEDRHLTIFKKELQTILEKEKSSFIELKIGKRTVKCSDIISTPKGLSRRDPKADFIILDYEGNHVGFISHKDGTLPTHFQQYGGLSDTAFNVPEVKKFMQELTRLYPSGLVSGVSVMRKVTSVDVIMKSIYGIDFGGKPGIQNVDEFHQGTMKLTKTGKQYTITSSHKGINGDKIDTRGYEPIFYARYTSDRGANIADAFIGKARVGVFPAAKAAATAIEI
jgi:hypothetical protein